MSKRFKNIICPECGSVLEPMLSDPDTLECNGCGRYQAYIGDGNINLLNLDEWNNTEGSYSSGLGCLDDRPPECTGCGSDFYPDCRESCGYFND